jgi:sigma-B regulation protein RsbU (phosphoserine phosphatase)
MLGREAELQIARDVQQALLPRMPRIAGLDMAAAWHPLDTLSGDFYDIIPLPNGSIGIVIGDVMGHGSPAALLMTTTRAYLRSLTRTLSDPGEILTQLNQLLEGDVGERFVTLLFAVIDPSHRLLKYANAGHGGCLILRAAEDLHFNDAGVPLGLFSDGTRYETSSLMPLVENDTIIFSTDGVHDATVGFVPIIDIIRRNSHRAAQDIVRLITDIILFLSSEPGRSGLDPLPGSAELYDALQLIREKFGHVPVEPDDVTMVVVKIG